MEMKNDVVHNVVMENRQKMSISAVTDVESFNEQEIVLNTQMGMLSIYGSMLHISKLNVETGELKVEGNVDNIAYEDKTSAKESFISRLFK